MSRGLILLLVILIVIVIVGGLVWLSRGQVAVQPHHIEQVVTLNGAADASQH